MIVSMHVRRITLRQFNNGLTLLVILLALTILILPFAPRLSFWLKKRADTTNGFAYQNNIKPRPDAKPVPKDNRVVIPSLLLDEPIKESSSLNVINNGGTWHRPKSSTPDMGGNTVIVGHRYTYKGLSTFYNLDKVKAGEPIIVYWNGKEYDYKITELKIILVILLLLFGATRLPKLAKSIGESAGELQKGFQSGVDKKDAKEDSQDKNKA